MFLKTLQRIFNELVITFFRPEIKTVARIYAERNIRNFFIESVMEEAHISIRDANLTITNLDATTMAVYAREVAIAREANDRDTVTFLAGETSSLGVHRSPSKSIP